MRQTHGETGVAGWLRTGAAFAAALTLACGAARAEERDGKVYAADGFRLAVPGWSYQFPRDHGSHDEFRTEWWYYTGNLETESGREYGFELTFFRVGVEPPSEDKEGAWEVRNLALTHFAVTDISRREFRYHEKVNRQTRFTADAATGTLEVFNEGWSARLGADGVMRIRARSEGEAIDLRLRSLKPPVIHGVNGVSVKAAGTPYAQASHYYSLTRLEAEGTISIDGRRESCRGLAWMDHEFSSSTLGGEQAGWDWFSIQLDDGTELMLYQMRLRGGGADETSSGTFVERDGSARHLRSSEFTIEPTGRWRSPESGATYPMGWRLVVPELGLELNVDEVMEDQELITSGSTRVTYWEGAVRVSGTRNGAALAGRGYVEMTGYDRALSLPGAAPTR